MAARWPGPAPRNDVGAGRSGAALRGTELDRRNVRAKPGRALLSVRNKLLAGAGPTSGGRLVWRSHWAWSTGKMAELWPCDPYRSAFSVILQRVGGTALKTPTRANIAASSTRRPQAAAGGYSGHRPGLCPGPASEWHCRAG